MCKTKPPCNVVMKGNGRFSKKRLFSSLLLEAWPQQMSEYEANMKLKNGERVLFEFTGESDDAPEKFIISVELQPGGEEPYRQVSFASALAIFIPNAPASTATPV